MFVCIKEQIDGFGSQFQNIIAAILYAGINDYEYVHRPVRKMEHNYDSSKKWINTINELMNVDKKYRTISDLRALKKEDRPKRYAIVNFKNFLDLKFETCLKSETLKEMKTSYLANKKPKEYYFPKGKIHIAVHVRRVNSHDNRGQQDFDKDYIKLMKKLNKEYKNCVFHFYSQGNKKGFRNFSSVFKNLVFHLDEPLEKSFHEMVIADVLVTSKSSMSYTAALLSDGEIYYKPFWHTCGLSWKQY